MSSSFDVRRASSTQSTLPNAYHMTARESLDLTEFPAIYVSATHLEADDLDRIENDLLDRKATLTYDISEATIVLSKVIRKPRIQFDLRSKGLFTKEVTPEPHIGDGPDDRDIPIERLEKGSEKSSANASVVNNSITDSERGLKPRKLTARDKTSTSNEHGYEFSPEQAGLAEPIIKVVSIAWLQDSKASGRIEPLEPYVNYKARVIQRKIGVEIDSSPSGSRSVGRLTGSSLPTTPMKPNSGDQILERAKEDSPAPGSKRDRFGRRKFGLNTPSANPASWEAGHGMSSQYVALKREASTESGAGHESDLPEMPDWVTKGVKYACQRVTLANGPNETFISMLQKIKLARLLTNDEIGVRAYSTSIASIAAYEREIKDAREILSLPGCDAKIANLFVEWTNTGKIKAIEDLEADGDLRVLRLFYDIWGVGATTAREFYYEKGWSDLDDIVDNGWSTLSRVQQIGVKYYEEFKDLIPRAEVERIGQIVHEHAVRVRDENIQSMIVGGYRRGKEASGDVDIIISHPEEGQTLNIVHDIVSSLEDEEWITHTLHMSLHNSNRGQATLPFRVGGGGHGFDTLDKALVVWQNPVWPSMEQDLAENPDAKNPNIHRRVDIIISPWRTVGCAIVGWSGGTTFERDLRRYAKHTRSWKFDSSGVRDRRNGVVVDMEGYFEWKGREGTEARAKTMEEAENRVFESMGIEYRAPWERCTH